MSLITYLPKIMEKANVNDRKAIFEVALLAENTKPEDLFDCVKNLRREDVTNIIYEFLNGEVNFQTVIDINFSPFSKTSYQNGLSDLISPEMKEKLLEVLDGATVDLFPDSDNKELKIFDDKHYEQDFLNLKNCFDAFINSILSYLFF